MAELFARGLIFASAAALAGCGDAATPGNATAVAPAPAAAPAPTPVSVAERLVRQRVGAGDLRFEGTRAYANGDVPVVCGSFAQAGRPAQRFVAVSDIDLWIESEMQAGQMDRAFAQYCRDGSANA